AEQARVSKEVDLQDVIRQKNEAAEEATTIVSATKLAEAKVIEAQGEEKAAAMRGEALRIESAKSGEGIRDKMTAEAEGRKAQASAVEKERQAEAAGQEAVFKAEATGVREKGLAEAEARRETGLADAEAMKAAYLAEADGVREKAEAYRRLEQSGKFMLVIENAPGIIEAIGEALSSVMTPAADAIGQGLANVDNIEILDLGSGGAAGGSGGALSRFMGSPVDAVWSMLKQVNAYGMTDAVGDLLKKAGIDPAAMLKGEALDSIDVGALIEGFAEMAPEDRQRIASALSSFTKRGAVASSVEVDEAEGASAE
ncbi:MAG: hypothetical protein PF636_00470, partial [Actinomycetota bacterium]|nr:hypothetical protein [Actinomycetota bacterium]